MFYMLEKTFEFFSEKARGAILTLTGTGVGTLPEVITKSSNVLTNPEISALENIQMWAYRASFVVALLTIISYGYKFFKFAERCYGNRKKKRTDITQ